MHSANDRGPYREFPWALFLPPDEVPRFLADVAAAGERGLDALEQTVTEWRHTAKIHADPDLLRRLSEPATGDHGTVLPPDQFDELMADDEPDPAPKLAEAAQRARRFVRREKRGPRKLEELLAERDERLRRVKAESRAEIAAELVAKAHEVQELIDQPDTDADVMGAAMDEVEGLWTAIRIVDEATWRREMAAAGTPVEDESPSTS